MHRNQTPRAAFVGTPKRKPPQRATGDVTQPRALRLLRDRSLAYRRKAVSFCAVAAPYPKTKPQAFYECQESGATSAPWAYIERPIHEVRDLLAGEIAAGRCHIGQMQAMRENFRSFLDQLADDFDAGLPPDQRVAVTLRPPVALPDAVRAAVREEGEAVVADLEVAARPDDPTVLAAAEKENREAAAARQRIATLHAHRLSSGKVARGLILT